MKKLFTQQIRRCLFVFTVIILEAIILAKHVVVQSTAGMAIEEPKELETMKMVEQAFIVDKDSKLYKEYFEAYAEKQKMHDLARIFFEKHDLLNDHLGYRMIATLSMQLTPEQEEKYKNQLKVTKDVDGMRYFKRSSPMHKEWCETVTNKVDFNIMEQLWAWYWPYIGQGSYALWHSGDNLYGYLSDKHKEKIELAEYMTPIKMSEYYLAKENHDA